ncbi:MAG TPA: ATP-binding protein [Anaerolineae bacterium]|nr:ATP-binding protein [Anaerolineae bacterium]HQH39508.1 ATP-binding protein [Anaerolineae bacterium]
MSAPPILIFSEDAPVAQELMSLLPPETTTLPLATVDALQQALPTEGNVLLVLHLSADDERRLLPLVREHTDHVSLVLIATTATPTTLINTLLENNLQALIDYPFQPQKVRETITVALARAQRRASRQHLQDNLAEANRQLNQRLQEINAIYIVGKSVASSLDMEEILERIVTASVNLTQAEEGFILLKKDERLYLRAAKNMREEVAKRFYVEASDPIAQQVIRSGRPVVLHRNTKIATGYLVRALLYVPIQSPGQGTGGVLGVVNLLGERTFTENHVLTLSAIADFASIALENARLFSIVEAERSRLSAILEHAAESILVTDTDNRLWLWSDSAAANFAIAPDAQGQPVETYIENASVRDLFVQSNADNAVSHAEVELEDGRVFNAQLSFIDHIGRVAVMQDISHLKELDRIKSEFVSTVSHDLRTPLTTIQGYIELLERVGPLSEMQRDFINKALNSLKHITAMIGDLLDIGRIEAGYDLEMQPLCINEIIRQSVEACALSSEQAALSIQADIADAPVWVLGNAQRIRQVMDNLLSNAIKYNRPGGWVKITAQPDEDHLIVSVEDNGIGIPLQEQPKIFERFYRVKSRETDDISGTGLGLSIVKSVIEKHKGRIWVRSYPGMGSTFAFILSLCEPPTTEKSGTPVC